MKKGSDCWWEMSAEELIGNDIMNRLDIAPGQIKKGMVTQNLVTSEAVPTIIYLIFNRRILWISGLIVVHHGTVFYLKIKKPMCIWKALTNSAAGFSLRCLPQSPSLAKLRTS